MTLSCAGIATALCLICAAPLWADTLRVATFNTELSRKGPGLLLRDILKGNDPQIRAVTTVITRTQPDILALQGFDWDYDNAALAAFSNALSSAGADFPYQFSAQPNSGLTTNLDLDGDAKHAGPGDAQGFGHFTGQGGIVILSKHPIVADQVQDFSPVLWRDVPGAELPTYPDGQPFPSIQAHAEQRLSNTGHWVVPIRLPNGQTISFLTFQAGPPVFDGPEDRNGRRNHDEILFWRMFLDGHFGTPPSEHFVLAGGANLDPADSEGRLSAITALLNDPRLQDPAPRSQGAAAAQDQGHLGENALDTVDWEGPGRLRVDYVLPSANWPIVSAGVFWPPSGSDDHAAALTASRHRMVWVDLSIE